MSTETWTIGRVLEWTRGYFAEKKIESARLDAELLLAHVLGKDRIYLYTHYDQPLVNTEREAYRALVLRRGKYEPVAQILGEREFFGRAFVVTGDVLTPRPETEHVVEAALAFIDAKQLKAPRILDIGTGSGCILLSLLAQIPEATGVGIDVSPAALAVAQRNVGRHDLAARATLHEGDLFAGEGVFDLVVSNPPYIPLTDRASLMPDVREFEPEQALFSGDDGLDVIRRLVTEAPGHLCSPGALIFEMGAGQWPAVQELLVGGDYQDVRVVHDLAGHARVAVGET